jgi:hypothetical protein
VHQSTDQQDRIPLLVSVVLSDVHGKDERLLVVAWYTPGAIDDTGGHARSTRASGEGDGCSVPVFATSYA